MLSATFVCSQRVFPHKNRATRVQTFAVVSPETLMCSLGTSRVCSLDNSRVLSTVFVCSLVSSPALSRQFLCAFSAVFACSRQSSYALGSSRVLSVPLASYLNSEAIHGGMNLVRVQKRAFNVLDLRKKM